MINKNEQYIVSGEALDGLMKAVGEINNSSGLQALDTHRGTQPAKACTKMRLAALELAKQAVLFAPIPEED